MDRICTHCVMDTSDTDITFNEKGVCNHCTEYQVREKQRRLQASQRPWIFHQMKKDAKDYDCLIGLSGGVDSSMCLHYLVQNGIKPLTFTIDNGWNTPEADENIMRMVEKLKVPFYRYTIDVEKFRELQSAFIMSKTLNIEIPTDHILMASTYEMARKYNIKWIVSGGNLATESIMPKSYGYNARDLRFIKDVYRKDTGKELRGLPVLGLLGYLYNRFWKKIQIVNLLDYYNYNRKESIELLQKEYGYKPYGEKHEESKFTKWFQDEYLIAYGIDKRRAHYSSLINSKQMTREEALKLLKPLKRMFEPKSYKEFKNSEKIWNLLSTVKMTLSRQ